MAKTHLTEGKRPRKRYTRDSREWNPPPQSDYRHFGKELGPGLCFQPCGGGRRIVKKKLSN